MSATHCCLPNCLWSRNKSKEKRSLFTVYRPEFARTDEEKEHRKRLTRFVLSMRDFTRGDIIRNMLHKESAAICDIHFRPEDIINRNPRRLVCGAIPCLHLRQTTSRKSPMKREPSPSKENHLAIGSSKFSTEKLNATMIDVGSQAPDECARSYGGKKQINGSNTAVRYENTTSSTSHANEEMHENILEDEYDSGDNFEKDEAETPKPGTKEATTLTELSMEWPWALENLPRVRFCRNIAIINTSSKET